MSCTPIVFTQLQAGAILEFLDQAVLSASLFPAMSHAYDGPPIDGGTVYSSTEVYGIARAERLEFYNSVMSQLEQEGLSWVKQFLRDPEKQVRNIPGHILDLLEREFERLFQPDETP